MAFSEPATEAASSPASISDEELTALALAASADEPLGDDAVPWRPDSALQPLIADWYMPAPIAARRDWRSRAIAATVVGSIVLINAGGLCVTYGRVILG